MVGRILESKTLPENVALYGKSDVKNIVTRERNRVKNEKSKGKLVTVQLQ